MVDIVYFISCIIGIIILATPIWLYILIATLAENHVNPKKRDIAVENIITITPPVESTIESTIEPTIEPTIEHSEEPIEEYSVVYTNDILSAQSDNSDFDDLLKLCGIGPDALLRQHEQTYREFHKSKERATQRKPINRDVMSNHVKYISDSSRLDICKWTQVIMTNLGVTPRDIADELGVNLMSVARFTSGEGYYVNIKLLAWFLNNDGYSDTHIIQERFPYENYDKKIRPIPSHSEYSLVLNTIYNSYIKAKNSGDQNVKLVLYMEYTKLQENDTVKQIEMPIIKPMLYYRYKGSEKTS